MFVTTPLVPHIVIGSNYGDEGKGTTVNWLAKKLQDASLRAPRVIRFNGGTQAGHTVQLKNGTRHVFRIHGSGAFQRSASYISEYCLIDVREAMQEETRLQAALGENLVPLEIHPDAKIITPIDVYLNQMRESVLGHGRLGSCGGGIGTTMERNLAGLTLPAKFPGMRYVQVKQKLLDIANWGHAELRKIVIPEGTDKIIADTLRHMQENWASVYSLLHPLLHGESLKWLYRRTGPLFENFYVPSYNENPNVIFEGAQGLLLDENDLDHQPHVTWSTTGATNPAKILREILAGNDGIRRRAPITVPEYNLYYVTRRYLTRHGNGPFLAGTEIPGVSVQDPTNKPNEWQGTLRVGTLDHEKLMQRISVDVEKFCSILDIGKDKINLTLVETWADAPYSLVPKPDQLMGDFLSVFKDVGYKMINVVTLDGRQG